MAYKWLAFVVVSVGVFIVTMDMSGLVVALPTLGSLFAEPLETVLWVILAYTLTFTSFMLTADRIADVVGRKRVFTLGFLIFTPDPGNSCSSRVPYRPDSGPAPRWAAARPEGAGRSPFRLDGAKNP